MTVMAKNTFEFEVYGHFTLFSDTITRSGSKKTSCPIPTCFDDYSIALDPISDIKPDIIDLV